MSKHNETGNEEFEALVRPPEFIRNQRPSSGVVRREDKDSTDPKVVSIKKESRLNEGSAGVNVSDDTLGQPGSTPTLREPCRCDHRPNLAPENDGSSWCESLALGSCLAIMKVYNRIKLKCRNVHRYYESVRLGWSVARLPSSELKDLERYLESCVKMLISEGYHPSSDVCGILSGFDVREIRLSLNTLDMYELNGTQLGTLNAVIGIVKKQAKTLNHG